VPGLSVTIITKNEAAHIEAALESVAWADERIVVDSGSSDDTVAIARRHAEVVVARDWPGYSEQKNHAASLARHDWILSLDADERVTPELAAEIRALLAAEPPARGYRMPRVTWYLGRWIRSTDWFPDHQLRLYDRRHGRWPARRVHESVQLDGPPGVLRHELRHYAYRDLSHHLATMDRYTTLAAEQMRDEGRRAHALAIALHPPAAFLRNYLLRLGFRDGVPGLIVSTLNSYYVFLKLAKLWALRHPAPEPGAQHPNPEPGTRHPAPD
jgi:glycosyltransferase involved in cell wall biosynthesis